ncbi:hypothetical protein V3595_17315 [Bacillus sp. CFBP9009]
MKKFALLVGNGFTLDFTVPLGLHSSFPLRNFNSLDISYDNDFMDHLPHIKEKLFGSDLSDFEAIKKYILAFKDIEEEERALINAGKFDSLRDPKYKIARDSHVQLRRFLAMAYSVFQLKVEQFDLSNWKWVQWLHENKSKLSFAISFNYDLLLENAFSLAGADFFRVGTNEFYKRIPLIKPHGSIDFDLPSNMIHTDNPWGVSATLNDAQMVHIVPKSKWLTPRIEADIISPSLHNIQMHLSWVRRMFEMYSKVVKELDTFVIVGCSYWDVDRFEIDYFLSLLSKRTKVYIADPFPNKELIKKIQGLGLSYRKISPSGLPW